MQGEFAPCGHGCCPECFLKTISTKIKSRELVERTTGECVPRPSASSVQNDNKTQRAQAHKLTATRLLAAVVVGGGGGGGD